MNNRDHLLADTLAEGNGGAFARAAAARVRRQRRLRRAAVAAGMLLVAGAGWHALQRPAPRPSLAAVTPAPRLEIMSDQELLTALRGQPVLFLKSDARITGVVFVSENAPEKKL